MTGTTEREREREREKRTGDGREPSGQPKKHFFPQEAFWEAFSNGEVTRNEYFCQGGGEPNSVHHLLYCIVPSTYIKGAYLVFFFW